MLDSLKNTFTKSYTKSYQITVFLFNSNHGVWNKMQVKSLNLLKIYFFTDERSIAVNFSLDNMHPTKHIWYRLCCTKFIPGIYNKFVYNHWVNPTAGGVFPSKSISISLICVDISYHYHIYCLQTLKFWKTKDILSQEYFTYAVFGKTLKVFWSSMLFNVVRFFCLLNVFLKRASLMSLL